MSIHLCLTSVLVDFPASASFLTPEERAFVVWRKSQCNHMPLLMYQAYNLHILEYDNSSVGEEERFAARHVWAALTDWQVRLT